MVAGIIAVAASDELVIAHPSNDVGSAAAAVILGGPALYLAGNALFKSAVWGYVPRYRLVGIAAIVSLALVAPVAPLLVLLALVTGVLMAVAAWDTLVARTSVEHLATARDA